MKIVCIGDPFVSASFMEEQVKAQFPDAEVSSIAWMDTPGMTREKFQPSLLKIEKEGSTAFPLGEEITEKAKDADILVIHIAPISANFLRSCPKLKLLCACRGGTEHININAASQLGIAVMNVIRNAEQTAEFTVGLMLAEVRNIARSHENLKKGLWSRSFPNKEFTAALYEMKVGLLGLGNVGKLVAKKLMGLGVTVMAWEPYITNAQLKEEGLSVTLAPIEEIFSTCDVVSIHMRFTPETKNFIGRKYISMMKPTSYLINSARAGVLEEQALIEALQKGLIAGAALDVFWEEPIPTGHPFLTLTNITMTSHLAGDTISAISRSPILMVQKMSHFLKSPNKNMLINDVEYGGR